jgi:hypothetical protein
MGANIFICTLLMWVLSAMVVVPLSRRLFEKAVAGNTELASAVNTEPVSEEIKTRLQKLQNMKFIQADVIVMGIAGAIAGMVGYPLIGISWKATAWPGLLAMIGASFLSCYLFCGSLRI